jgi:hypothetical protein
MGAGKTGANKSPTSKAAESAKLAESRDSVEFSLFAELVDTLKDLPELREGVIAEGQRLFDDPKYPSATDLYALGQAFAAELTKEGEA